MQVNLPAYFGGTRTVSTVDEAYALVLGYIQTFVRSAEASSDEAFKLEVAAQFASRKSALDAALALATDEDRFSAINAVALGL